MANDPSSEKYYEDLIDMFQSPGWRSFLQEVQEQIDYLENIRTVQTEAELNHRKGQLMILDNLKNLETVVGNVRDAYEEGAK